jgi:hypothetical protein
MSSSLPPASVASLAQNMYLPQVQIMIPYSVTQLGSSLSPKMLSNQSEMKSTMSFVNPLGSQFSPASCMIASLPM